MFGFFRWYLLICMTLITVGSAITLIYQGFYRQAEKGALIMTNFLGSNSFMILLFISVGLLFTYKMVALKFQLKKDHLKYPEELSFTKSHSGLMSFNLKSSKTDVHSLLSSQVLNTSMGLIPEKRSVDLLHAPSSERSDSVNKRAS